MNELFAIVIDVTPSLEAFRINVDSSGFCSQENGVLAAHQVLEHLMTDFSLGRLRLRFHNFCLLSLGPKPPMVKFIDVVLILLLHAAVELVNIIRDRVTIKVHSTSVLESALFLVNMRQIAVHLAVFAVELRHVLAVENLRRDFLEEAFGTQVGHVVVFAVISPYFPVWVLVRSEICLGQVEAVDVIVLGQHGLGIQM